MASIVLDMDESLYHAHSALSSTEARRILESPAKYQYAKTHPQEPKAVFDLGHAVHAKVLGVGAQVVVIPDTLLASNGAVSTVAAKEFIESARASGKIPVKQDVADEVNATAESVLAHPMARVLLTQVGNPEVSVFATDPETDVELRARFDYLPSDGQTPVGVDLKTARSASPHGFTKAVAEHGYHIQRGHYTDTYTLAGGELAGFTFVVVETEPPYLVGVYKLETEWEEIGVTRARLARRIYAEALTADRWRGYSDDIVPIRAPFWVVANEAETTLV